MSGRALLAAALVLAAACKGGVPGVSRGAGGGGVVAEGRALLEGGQPDAALAKLQQAPDDPESLFLQGRAWAKKAETAPLPTAPPPAPGAKPGEALPAPEFKDEEVTAAGLFERAIAARPADPAPHLALAALLAPHAAHLHDLAEEQARSPHKPAAAPPAPPIDASPDRVIRAYELAMQADPASPTTVDDLIRFGRRVGRLDAVETGLKEQLRRTKEAATVGPLVRYGDFLATEKKDPQAAVEQYTQALIWKPDDDATRAKVADIYIAMGTDYYAKQQYAMAETSFKEAARFVTDRSSAEGRTVEDYQGRLRAIREPGRR